MLHASSTIVLLQATVVAWTSGWKRVVSHAADVPRFHLTTTKWTFPPRVDWRYERPDHELRRMEKRWEGRAGQNPGGRRLAMEKGATCGATSTAEGEEGGRRRLRLV